jgi:hypothetical protein
MEALAAMVAYGVQALGRTLPCQASSQEEEDGGVEEGGGGGGGGLALANAIFGFLDALVSRCPAAFDTRAFVEAADRALCKERTIECARATGTLGRLFESARSEFRGLLQKFLIQTGIEVL